MLEVIALIGTTLAIAFFALPFWSFIRVSRLTREVEHLRTRLDRLERPPVSPPPPVPAATPSPVTASVDGAAFDAAQAAEAPSLPLPPPLH
ncbi:MAG: hypothetical protein IT178_15745, partial [Acidobacteria bacterium]|nr:hypothetical protein [Acidobacteriota bacterium]